MNDVLKFKEVIITQIVLLVMLLLAIIYCVHQSAIRI